ncbi:MAG: purine-nucleoside phosphorylase [Planctomycetes bacterium]|nr:purine-nucleoside phosphorylase [Planctomycetota bacterium]
METAPPGPGTERALAEAAAAALRARAGGPLDAVVVLGSGVGGPALEGEVHAPLGEFPSLPAPSVEGHGATLSFGTVRGLRVLVAAGRVHLYEGRTPAEAARLVRAAGLAGARLACLTNAAGGVAPWMKAGDLLLLSDHLDLGRGDPAAGEPEGAFGPRFASMAGAWDPALRAAGLEAARAARATAAEGVYAFLRGPAFETEAEVRMLRTLGADAVGMSTVPEALGARRLGMALFGLSVVANRAGTPGGGHGEVLAAVRARSGATGAVLGAVLAAFAGRA